MTQIKSISVSEEFNQLAKTYNVSWSEAARVGMAILLGDIGVREYDNNLNVYRKMRYYQNRTEEMSKQIEDLKEKVTIGVQL